MSGLFDEMEADANAFGDIKTEDGGKLSQLIRAAQHQKRLIEEHEQAAKDAKAELKQLTRELIPSEMQEMGLERIDVDGNSVTLNQFVYASIPEANKARRSHSSVILVKTTLSRTKSRFSLAKAKTTKLVRSWMIVRKPDLTLNRKQRYT